MLIWGRNYHAFPPIFPSTEFDIVGATITGLQVAIIAIAALMMIGLTLLIQRTRLGRVIRVSSENSSNAQ